MRLKISREAALIVFVVLALTVSATAASLFHQHDLAGRVCQVCHFAQAPSVRVGPALDLPPLAALGSCALPLSVQPPSEPLISHKLPRAPPA